MYATVVYMSMICSNNTTKTVVVSEGETGRNLVFDHINRIAMRICTNFKLYN